MDLARRGSSGVSRSREPATQLVGAAVMLLVWLGLASSVGAQPRVAELALEANAGCFDAQALRTRLAASLWQLLAPPAASAELFLAASVRPAEAGQLAVRLRVTWPDGRSAQRALAAESCEAALDALVLLVNMTLDAAQPLAADVAPTRGEPSALDLEQVLVGANFGFGSGSQPGLAPELGLFAALGLRGVGWLRPRIQLELSHAWRSGIAAAGGTADVTLDGGQLRLCPVGMRLGFVGLAADGCGVYELARLRARGYDTYAARTAVRPWSSLGVGVLLRALPLPALALQLGAALLAPLWRDELSFAPDVFYAVPAWRWQLKLGVALSFL